MTGTSRVGAAITLCLAFALVASPAEAAKKKKAAEVFQQSQAVNLAVPDDAAVGLSTPLIRTITVPKSFKGRVVGDVDLIGVRTTGNLPGAAGDLALALSAPGGTLSQVFVGPGDQSLGPWTIDDDTLTSICNAATPVCRDPDASLLRPFAGTSNELLLGNGGGETGPLSAFNGSPMSGVWTVRIWDDSDLGQTSTLNAWGLRIAPAKPVPSAARQGKSRKGGSVFRQTLNPNAAIADGALTGPSIAFRSAITVGKAFKGKVVGDLNVTGIRTTGSGPTAAQDLGFKLTAPNGRTMRLFSDRGDQSLGPLTLDDETSASICDAPTPCEDPAESLPRPFAGTANVIGAGAGGTGPLSVFDGLPVRGTWTLSVFDEAISDTNTLNSWGLEIASAKPSKADASSGGKAASSANKKNAKAKAPVFRQQKPVVIAIPQDAAAGASTAGESAITVGKKFKGLRVGDLDLTAVQTVGTAPDAADDLSFRLIAPNGNTARVIDGVGDQSIGPLTLNDDTPASLCVSGTLCSAPTATLLPPYSGTANMLEVGTAGTGPLSSFDGAPMRGTWTLRVVDISSAATSSTLTSWGLKLTPAKPVTG